MKRTKLCAGCQVNNASGDNKFCDDCFLGYYKKAKQELNVAESAPKGGLKYDDEKPRMDLLDPEFLEEVAAVMTFGAKKYAAHNWRQGLAVSRLLAAALRHIFAVLKGEDRDPESSKSHIAHATCCLMFAFWMLKHKPELDDRYKTAVSK